MTEELQKPEYLVESLTPKLQEIYWDTLRERYVEDGYTYIADWLLTALRVSKPEKYTPEEEEIIELDKKGLVVPVQTKANLTNIANSILAYRTISESSAQHIIDEHAQPRAKSWYSGIVEGAQEQLIGLLDAVFEWLDKNEVIPEELYKDFRAQYKEAPVTWALPAAFIAISAILTTFGTNIRSYMVLTERNANKRFQHNIPDWHDLMSRAFYDPATKQMVTELLLDYGIADKYHDALFRSAKALLSVSDIFQLSWRGEINDAKANELLQRSGLIGEERDLVKKLLPQIPGIADLITMAVREAWADDIAAQFGYDRDFPREFAEWAEKQGYDPDWAKRYWRAHWTLPGPSLGYEMLHRRVIDREDLENLLRAQDYPEFWREGMIKVSYNPFTRVDVRRMYERGILNEQEVYEAYLDVGYAPDKAEKMTEFTIAFYQERDKDLTRSNILTAYRKGILTRDDAEDFLTDTGYDKDEADILIRLEEQKIQDEWLDTSLDVLKAAYIRGRIDTTTVLQSIAKLEISPERGQLYLATWDIEKEAKLARPSRSVLGNWLKKGIITQEEYRTEMRVLGWEDVYIDRFVLELQAAE